MSRIESALEKAAQLRSGAAHAASAEKTQDPVASPRVQGPTRTIAIAPGNRLLATLSEPHSAVAEQYRKLKGSLVRITQEETFRNLIVVTSAIAGEGKSLTAANLAISLAQEYDLTVLLVDADLRRPSIHDYFGFERGIGLSDCLQDGSDIGEAIVKTDLGKLSIISAGREVEKPLELFASKRMEELLAEIKTRYSDRYVIIDTPPLLAFAESRALAHMVDGIVFVVQEGVTPQKDVMEAKELLKGCPVLGVVLNDSTTAIKENSHYNGYYGRSTT